MTLKTRSRASRITRSARGVVVDHTLDEVEAAAGGERLAGAPQISGDAHVGVAVDREPDVGQLSVDVGVTAFRPGAIERDAEHAVVWSIERQPGVIAIQIVVHAASWHSVQCRAHKFDLVHAPRGDRRELIMDLHDGTPFWPRRDGILVHHD